jgi:hypothetical protein
MSPPVVPPVVQLMEIHPMTSLPQANPASSDDPTDTLKSEVPQVPELAQLREIQPSVPFVGAGTREVYERETRPVVPSLPVPAPVVLMSTEAYVPSPPPAYP